MTHFPSKLQRFPSKSKFPRNGIPKSHILWSFILLHFYLVCFCFPEWICGWRICRGPNSTGIWGIVNSFCSSSHIYYYVSIPFSEGICIWCDRRCGIYLAKWRIWGRYTRIAIWLVDIGRADIYICTYHSLYDITKNMIWATFNFSVWAHAYTILCVCCCCCWDFTLYLFIHQSFIILELRDTYSTLYITNIIMYVIINFMLSYSWFEIWYFNCLPIYYLYFQLPDISHLWTFVQEESKKYKKNKKDNEDWQY